MKKNMTEIKYFKFWEKILIKQKINFLIPILYFSKLWQIIK